MPFGRATTFTSSARAPSIRRPPRPPLRRCSASSFSAWRFVHSVHSVHPCPHRLTSCTYRLLPCCQSPRHHLLLPPRLRLRRPRPPPPQQTRHRHSSMQSASSIRLVPRNRHVSPSLLALTPQARTTPPMASNLLPPSSTSRRPSPPLNLRPRLLALPQSHRSTALTKTPPLPELLMTPRCSNRRSW